MLIILLPLLMVSAIIASISLCYYSWKLADLRKNNSEYVGLFMVGVSSIIMVVILSAGSDPSSIIPICGIIIASFTFKSKLFHRELMILNTLKRGIPHNTSKL